MAAEKWSQVGGHGGQGVYWFGLREILDDAKFKLKVVNRRHVSMIAGRKSDIKDCRSLASLHSKGALEERGGFVPPSDTRRLQDYVRLRQNHVTAAGRETQHKQKALESMNLKPRDVIRTLTGMSGMNMIRAIVEGERDPAVLVELCVDRVRWAKPEKLKDALTGTWKERERNAVPSLVAQQRQ